MNMDELLKKYRNISLDVISAVDNDNLELMDKLILEREKVLKLIFDVNITKEELKKLYKKYDLFNIDSRINEKFHNELEKLKSKISKVKISKEASKSYNTINAKSVFLSKKI